MPIEIIHSQPNHTLLHYKVRSPWDWDDFYTALEASLEVWEQDSAQQIDLVIDLSAIQAEPEGADLRFGSMSQSVSLRDGKLKRIVFVKDQPSWQSLVAETLGDALPRIHHTVNLEEAYRLLNYRQ